MKPRPPSMREKRRYILAQIEPRYADIDAKRIYYALHDAITAIWGDASAADINMAVVAYEDGYAVIRCRRGREPRAEAALAAITRINGSRVAVHPLATSGTIHALKRRMRPYKMPERTGENRIGEINYVIYALPGQKVDLCSKGIKNQKRLYFTHDDMEVP